jgi:hypothetical protein
MSNTSSALIFVLTLVIALAWLNVAMTLAVLRSNALRTGQKIAQCALIWLVPLVGALLVRHVLRERIADHHQVALSSESEVDPYVNQSLGVQARAANRVARQQLEDAVVEITSESSSSAGAVAD